MAVESELAHTASDQFRARGVAPGDAVYVVSFHRGVLRVLGRLDVDRVVTRTQAQRALGTQNLWEAADHLLGKPGTVMRYQPDAVVPSADLRRLEFVSPDGTINGVVYNRHGNVDPQSFRSLREVTPATAGLFDGILRQGRSTP
jgi:hypothetical protein